MASQNLLQKTSSFDHPFEVRNQQHLSCPHPLFVSSTSPKNYVKHLQTQSFQRPIFSIKGNGASLKQNTSLSFNKSSLDSHVVDKGEFVAVGFERFLMIVLSVTIIVECVLLLFRHVELTTIPTNPCQVFSKPPSNCSKLLSLPCRPSKTAYFPSSEEETIPCERTGTNRLSPMNGA